MRQGPTSRLRNFLLTLAVAGTTLSAAVAAEPPANGDLLSDYVHYTRIARYDAAKSFGQALLDQLAKPLGNAADGKGLSAVEFVKLVESSGEAGRFEETVLRGGRVGEIETVSNALLKAYEQGKLDQARNSDELTKNIKLLIGTQRQRTVARERLAFAGEYAMPRLLEALQTKTDPALQSEVRQLIVDMGRSGLMPLSAALPGLDPAAQETVVGILGQMPYRASLPFLYDLHADTKSSAVKAAAEKAIATLGGGFYPETKPSALYSKLADSYAQHQSSLVAFPREETQPVWQYKAGVGLYATSINSKVYHDVMAMSLAERALNQDSSDGNALAIWLASNFSRELNSPKGYANPLWPAGRRDAMYYAVAAGPASSQAVLGRALDAKDTALARKAIAAIEKTAGGAALSSPIGDGRRPLLEALRYPSRRVQYEAALALAAGQPSTTFDGAERVVPTLASAIRDVSARYAAVVAVEREVGESLSSQLRAMGFTVLPVGASLADVERASGDVPGIDLLVTALPGSTTGALVKDLRGNTRLLATPVVAVLSAQGEIDAGADTTRDPLVRTARQGLDPAQFGEAVKQFTEATGSGPVTAEEAVEYQSRALTALRDIALSGGTVFSAADAVQPLTAGFSAAKGPVKMQIAEVLSVIGDKRAQSALAEAALDAQGDELIALVGKLAYSAKRSGNLLDERQTARFIDLASKGSDAQATAVAGLLGALNLPNANLVPLILGQEQKAGMSK